VWTYVRGPEWILNGTRRCLIERLQQISRQLQDLDCEVFSSRFPSGDHLAITLSVLALPVLITVSMGAAVVQDISVATCTTRMVITPTPPYAACFNHIIRELDVMSPWTFGIPEARKPISLKSKYNRLHKFYDEP
jgi:hypothetical protein